jgi:hypothetical protein
VRGGASNFRAGKASADDDGIEPAVFIVPEKNSNLGLSDAAAASIDRPDKGHVDGVLGFELLGEIRLATDHHPNRDMSFQNL